MARNKANGVATLGPNGIRLAHPVHDLFILPYIATPTVGPNGETLTLPEFGEGRPSGA